MATGRTVATSKVNRPKGLPGARLNERPARSRDEEQRERHDGKQDYVVCAAGKKLQHRAVLNSGHGVRTHVYRAPKGVCSACPLRDDCAPPGAKLEWRRSVTRIEEPGATTAFKAKMKTAEAQQIYAQRSRVDDFVHAWVKERCGLRQFRRPCTLKA